MAAAAAAGMRGPSAFDLEPGTELSLQDLDRIDQSSPEKHRDPAAAAAGAKGVKSPRRGLSGMDSRSRGGLAGAAGRHASRAGEQWRRAIQGVVRTTGGWKQHTHLPREGIQQYMVHAPVAQGCYACVTLHGEGALPVC